MRVNFERRRHPRQKTILGACVLFIGWRSTLACQIRDLTPFGARIRHTGSTSLPNRFDLHLVAKDETREVEVVWASATEAGVAFVRPDRDAVPADTDKVLFLDAVRESRRLNARREERRSRLPEEV